MTGVMTREFRRNFTELIAQPKLSLVEVDHRFRCLASSGAGRWRRNRVASVADFDAGETGLLRVKDDRELSNERSINSGSDGVTRPHQFAPPSPQRERPPQFPHDFQHPRHPL